MKNKPVYLPFFHEKISVEDSCRYELAVRMKNLFFKQDDKNQYRVITMMSFPDYDWLFCVLTQEHEKYSKEVACIIFRDSRNQKNRSVQITYLDATEITYFAKCTDNLMNVAKKVRTDIWNVQEKVI